jgi:hypothetical protein
MFIVEIQAWIPCTYVQMCANSRINYLVTRADSGPNILNMFWSSGFNWTLKNKLRRNIQKKPNHPHPPPPSLHTKHKMGHLHAFLTTCQKNHQPIQKHKCQSYLQINNTIAQLTKPHTTTIPFPNPHDISAIYTLTCYTCKLACVGQTRRSLRMTPGTHTLHKEQWPPVGICKTHPPQQTRIQTHRQNNEPPQANQ